MRTLVLTIAGSALALAGCTASATSEAVNVNSSDTTCDVAPTSAPAGSVVFSIENSGTQTTEFYVYGEGDKVMAELEDITVGQKRVMVANLSAGTYRATCKPGMVGEGISTEFTVTN